MKVPYDFPGGITVLVPKQRKRQIVAVDKKSIPKSIKTETHGFVLIRHIANIVLYYKTDVTSRKRIPIRNFGPPIEICVAYDSTDLNKVDGDINLLKLAYWDGRKWVIISDSSHGFHIFPPATGKIAVVKVRSWAGDPPLAWGK
jgi:hypothetical protein